MADDRKREKMEGRRVVFVLQIIGALGSTVGLHVGANPRAVVGIFKSLAITDDAVNGLHMRDQLTMTHRDGSELLKFLEEWVGECDFSLLDSEGSERFTFQVKTIYI